MTTTLSDSELTALKATTCEQEWNEVCDTIKRRCGGTYPDDWWARVMITGLAAQIVTSWHSEASLTE